MDLKYRDISDQELRVAMRLLSSSSDLVKKYGDALKESRVASMDDGGMGSLIFFSSTAGERKLDRAIAEGEFVDEDGTLVSVVLNIDDRGELYELDSWKVDYSNLISWPESERIELK